MSKSYIPYLQHILEECRYVRSVVPDDAKMYELLYDTQRNIQPLHLYRGCSGFFYAITH